MYCNTFDRRYKLLFSLLHIAHHKKCELLIWCIILTNLQTHLYFNRGSTHFVWFGLRKKIFSQAFAIPPLYFDFYRLHIGTSRCNWLPRILFVLLINSFIICQDWRKSCFILYRLTNFFIGWHSSVHKIGDVYRTVF